MRVKISRWLVLLALALGAGAKSCLAQPQPQPQAQAQLQPQEIDLDQQRQLFAAIGQNWRTHPGDDARWSQADFDDAGWKVLQPSSEWNAQGYAEQDGMAWFRFRLHVPAGLSSLVILLPRIEKSYQLFADGTLIGQVGELPPQTPRPVISGARVFTVPLQRLPHAQDITIALRLWQAGEYVNLHTNILRGRAYAGDAPTVLRQFELAKSSTLLGRGSDYTQDIIAVIVGAASLLLFWLTRQRFYLWFAVYNGLSAAKLPVTMLSQHFAWDYSFVLYLYIFLDFASSGVLAIFLLKSLNLDSGYFGSGYSGSDYFGSGYFSSGKGVVTAILLAFMAEIGPLALIFWKMPSIWANGIYFVFALALQLLLAAYLVRGWRAGMVDAKLLLFPYALDAFISACDNLGHFLSDLHVPYAEKLISADINLLRVPFTVTLSDVGSIISLLGFLAVLVYRFARTSREQQRLASALQAAHDIQHRLVPVDIPSLGGLHTNVVYLAAEEVGGDFCQVLPRSDGSILVAVGDVSGKGLQAAMLGTLAVGALRSIADEELDPAAALRRLNQVLLQTGSLTFVTCLCLVLTTDGQVTVANAGHLAPYLNGEEVPIISGLPLGVVAEADYQQTSFPLPATARLTLLSDGVVEARSASGELFGFERTARASQLSAAQIAEQANRHGQQDDITVITLDWQAPVLKLVPESLPEPQLV